MNLISRDMGQDDLVTWIHLSWLVVLLLICGVDESVERGRPAKFRKKKKMKDFLLLN